MSCAFWPYAYCYPFWSYGTAFAYDYGPYAPAYGYGGTGNAFTVTPRATDTPAVLSGRIRLLPT